MSQKNRVRPLFARFCLLTYLLASMVCADNVYGFLIILDHSHKLVLALDGDEIHLIFYRIRNEEHDDNQLQSDDYKGHEHNSAYNVNNTAITKRTDDPDQEILFSEYQQQFPPNSKKIKLTKIFFHLIKILPFLDFHTSRNLQYVKQHTSKDSPTFDSLRTTVLLI